MNKIKGPLEKHFEAILKEMDLPRVKEPNRDFKTLEESCTIIGIPYSFDLSRLYRDSEVEIYLLEKTQAIYLSYLLRLEGFNVWIKYMNSDISVITVALMDWEDGDYWDVKYYIEDNTALCLVSVQDLIEVIKNYNDTLSDLINETDDEAIQEGFALVAVYGQILARVKRDLSESN